MQSSISAVEVFIANTTKLFFSPKDPLLAGYKMQGVQRKKLIISTLCLMPCLSAHALVNEGVVAPTTDVATPAATPAAVVQTPQAAPPAVAMNEISSLIASKQHPYLTQSHFTYRAEDLDALYKANNYQPIWLVDDGKANKNVDEAIKMLEAAAGHGLNPADYDTEMLRQKLTALKAPFDVHSKDVALYDTAISLSLLRFMHNLHYGRINPNDLHFNIQRRAEKTLDLPALIKANLAADTLPSLPSLVEPTLQQYQKLKQALASYRAPEKIPPLNLLVNKTIRQGDALPQSAELQKYLAAFGDIPSDKIDNTATTYTATMVEGVKNFQKRHSIKANGLINKATVAALNAPLIDAERITQIELAMERLRWLPEITEGPVIIVNIPAFQLSAFDDIKQDIPTTTMRVVVGKAAKNQTPQLAADMRFVDFQPYWNVPYKIAKDEILPKLAADPEYLTRQNMEFVSGSGSSALRIRQRPGKGNALGKVKFIFPNASSVYLHDTPSVALFSRPRRDLSHGCVRVAHPQALAEFVLKDQGGWDTDAIKKAMGGKNRQVVLKKTIPVLFLYNTAFFNEHSNLTFYTDIYHRDAELLDALTKHQDLSDQVLFAPKEVPPSVEPIEAEAVHAEAVVAANTKQAVPVVQSMATTNTAQVARTIQPATNTEEKSASAAEVVKTDSTLSP
ncbi:MAG: L,D-transpeptidase family protein [Methylococcales bacterium]|nr:L,D-transpeptidase family protein [Methylococcales bacterium]